MNFATGLTWAEGQPRNMARHEDVIETSLDPLMPTVMALMGETH